MTRGKDRAAWKKSTPCIQDAPFGPWKPWAAANRNQWCGVDITQESTTGYYPQSHHPIKFTKNIHRFELERNPYKFLFPDFTHG
jgi:hypothetical protein